jgi:hypothetical protein
MSVCITVTRVQGIVLGAHYVEASFGRIFIVGHNVIARIDPLVLGISAEEE